MLMHHMQLKEGGGNLIEIKQAFILKINNLILNKIH